jgi:hypothetical protein
VPRGNGAPQVLQMPVELVASSRSVRDRSVPFYFEMKQNGENVSAKMNIDAV